MSVCVYDLSKNVTIKISLFRWSVEKYNKKMWANVKIILSNSTAQDKNGSEEGGRETEQKKNNMKIDASFIAHTQLTIFVVVKAHFSPLQQKFAASPRFLFAPLHTQIIAYAEDEDEGEEKKQNREFTHTLHSTVVWFVEPLISHFQDFEYCITCKSNISGRLICSTDDDDDGDGDSSTYIRHPIPCGAENGYSKFSLRFNEKQCSLAFVHMQYPLKQCQIAFPPLNGLG